MDMVPENLPIIDIQIATGDESIPANDDFLRWVSACLAESHNNSEVTIRLVGMEESQELNRQYRHQDKPTNVLSFPSELPEHIDLNLLGDLVICSAIVEQEAQDQNKQPCAHWAHMVVHGMLHLQGYDHLEDDQATEMETLESDIMMSLGYPDPYAQ